MAELLKVNNITKTFGGIVAVNNLSFEIHEGETLGFIGPNGAGKSTVVNVLSGYLDADSGQVEMNGVNITNMKPHQRAHMGLARTYQIPRPFPELTALASVATSALCGKKRVNQSFEDAMVEATHYLDADSGEIEMNGVNITNMKPYQRAHMGLARTYQIPRPFPELTALASVATSALCGKKRVNQSFEDAMVEATHYLEFVGLFSKRAILARDLTFYELRMLELARSLATTPKLIFIDEVMAGLNPGEARDAIQLIARAKEQFGITIFWIEHVMAVLMESADRIIAINYGEKLAEGTPDEVVNNEAVIEAYLGRGWKAYA